ncbi:MAG: GNAT family N-acetyltransferase [Tabrizicola sp.]
MSPKALCGCIAAKVCLAKLVKNPKHIKTTRLGLRPLSALDLRFFLSLIGNDETRRYLGGPVRGWQAIRRFRTYLLAPSEALVWVVFVGRSRNAIGIVEVGPHKDGEDHELSYQFLPEQWGNGYAGEAVAAVIEIALGALRLNRIIAETQSANSASRRLLERSGMVELRRVQRFGEEQVIYTT